MISQSSYIISYENKISTIYNNRFTIIIPAYNEEERIFPVLNDVCHFIVENKLPWEIIVAVDGYDSTYTIVKRLANIYKFIIIDRNQSRTGKGGAIKRVLSKITGEYIILMDADNSIGFNEIIKAVNELEKNDVIILSRYIRQNTIPLMRRFLSRGFNLIVRTMFGLNISDTQSGYKLFRSDLFVKAMGKVTVTNASYDISLLYHVKKMGGKIIEIPAIYMHADNGKLRPISMAMSFSISLFALRIRNSPIYVYVPQFIIDLYRRKFRWI
jgi:glycosyltransferase involved in cell wall biosynthesis